MALPDSTPVALKCILFRLNSLVVTVWMGTEYRRHAITRSRLDRIGPGEMRLGKSVIMSVDRVAMAFVGSITGVPSAGR